MALALIDFVDYDKNQARFNIDIGTNNYFKLKIGKNRTENGGIKWVDEVIHSTALKKLNQVANLLNTHKEISLPINYFRDNAKYIQLFSFKNETGRSPAFSKIITVPISIIDGKGIEFLSLSTSIMTDPMYYEPLNTCRYIPSSEAQYSYQTGFEDILGKIVQLAGPIINNLLSAQQNNPGPQKPDSSTQGPVGLLNTILNSLLNGFSGMKSLSGTQTLLDSDEIENRFAYHGQTEYAQPFIAFAALIPLIKPLIDVLPQLMKEQNESKLKMRQETNKLTNDIVSDVNKRMMLLQVLQQMPQNTPVAAGMDPAQLMQMIQQISDGAATSSPASTTNSSLPSLPALNPLPPVSITKSLLNGTSYSSSLSSSTIINFEFPKTTTWNGTEKNVMLHGSDVLFNLKLTVAGSPKNSLPKAILKICLKDKVTGKAYVEKTFKQKNLSPNTPLDFAFTKEELSAIPANSITVVYGEMRWQNKAGSEIKALGSCEVVFSSPYFVREGGKPVADEKELKDMKLYKTFWSKIWESPVLDAANQRNPDKKKYRWSLDANGKFYYMLTAQHDSNGIVDTKFLAGEKDAESLTEKTEGRLKAGMELSVSELNKLASLWDKQSPLPTEKLIAFKNELFVKNNATEFIFNYKLDGSTRERGMIWVVPVMRLHEFTLSKVISTDKNGVITGTEEDKVQFPLPESGRVIGLKSS